MRVMYIAPRYHTNQIPIVKGWIEHGDEVCFVSRCSGPIEDYSLIEPVEIPYSAFSNFLAAFYKGLHKNDPYAADFSLKYGFPSGGKLRKLLKEFKPDIVVLREKSIYSMACFKVCKKLGIKGFTYNQSPLYDYESALKRGFAHRLVDARMPKVRYTPVRVKDFDYKDKVQDPNAFFAPFVSELRVSPTDKRYNKDDFINILEIGRFEKRKNHILMLEAFEKVLKVHGNARLTIVGEVSDPFHEEHLKEVEVFIKDHGMQGNVTIRTNQKVSDMEQFYREADLYVLPSSNEPAAVSILEAMGFSLPVICSTSNGTADYIEAGESGFVFKSDDSADLADKILEVVKNTDTIKRMGAKSYELARTKYQFANYYDAIVSHM